MHWPVKQISASLRVFSSVSTKFRLDQERWFYYEIMAKNLCVSVFADISSRSSRTINKRMGFLLVPRFSSFGKVMKLVIHVAHWGIVGWQEK